MSETAQITQIALVVFGVGAVWLTQCTNPKLRRIAPIVGLLGQPFWFVAAWGQPGMLFVVSLYTLVWAKGCWQLARCNPDVNSGLNRGL